MKSSPYGPLVRILIRLFVAGGPLRWLFGVALLAVVGLSVLRPGLLSDARRPNNTEPSQRQIRVPSSDETTSAEDVDWRSDERQASDDRVAPDGTVANSDRAKESSPTGRDQRASETDMAMGGLVRLPGGVLRSPGGLLYTRGSAEGHRLDHVLAHGVDQRGRPGNHGVFAQSDREWIVSLIDEAYQQGRRGIRSRQRQEDGRTIYTVDMGREIGYIGGDTGNRDGRPKARHIRLVLEEQRVITAYPIIP